MAATASAARVKGLDLGTSRIVLAEPHGENMNFEVQLNAFVTLPLSNMTKSMFERAGILHFVEDYQIIAYGNRVDDFANMLSGDTQRPMQNGLLNAAEPKSLQIVELAIENICGPARKGEKITFSVPSATPENESDLIYHQQAITQLLENLGYKVQSVNEGLAVVYSELMESDFTGFGISFGAGLCNVCFAYLGLPVLNFCMTRAGDYIDRCAASVTGETLTNLRLYKERDFSLTGFTSVKVDQALSVYYDDVIQGVVRGIEQQLAESNKIPNLNHPVPVAFAGGTARVGGFQAALQEALESADLPIEISVVRLSKDPLNTTAKGTFVAAATNM